MEYQNLVSKALDLVDETDIVASHSNLEVTLGYELYGKETKYEKIQKNINNMNSEIKNIRDNNTMIKNTLDSCKKEILNLCSK